MQSRKVRTGKVNEFPDFEMSALGHKRTARFYFFSPPRRAREERAAALWLMAEHAHHQAPEIEAQALSDLGQRLLASRGLSNAKEKMSHDVNYRINSTPKNMHKLRHGAPTPSVKPFAWLPKLRRVCGP